MRLAVLADTHGNLPALKAVLADIRTQGVDGYLVAGDITGGPQTGETIGRLLSLDGWMIRGNGEEYLLDFRAGRAPASWYTHDQWATLRWSYRRLDPEILALIDDLPDQRVVALDGSAPIRMVHGTPWSTRDFLYPDLDPLALDAFRRAGLLPVGRPVPRLTSVLGGISEEVLVCAHSHIPWVQESPQLLAVNPGSVGASNNGDPRAHYALLTWQSGRWRAVLKAVAYDLDRVRAAYRDSGFLAAGGVMAEAFLLGIVTGENVPGRFVNCLRELAAGYDCQMDDGVPEHVWREAIAAFDWGVGQDAILPYLGEQGNENRRPSINDKRRGNRHET